MNFYTADFETKEGRFRADFGFVLEEEDLPSWEMSFSFKESQILEGYK